MFAQRASLKPKRLMFSIKLLEVGPVKVVIMYPCRLTPRVKTFISYRNCRFIFIVAHVLLYFSTRLVNCLICIVSNVPN